MILILILRANPENCSDVDPLPLVLAGLLALVGASLIAVSLFVHPLPVL